VSDEPAYRYNYRSKPDRPLPWRRPCLTEKVDGFAVTVSYDPRPLFHEGRAVPCEAFITNRAKSGSELEAHQVELSIAMSKMMQGET